MDIQNLTSPLLMGMCVGGIVFLIMVNYPPPSGFAA